MCRGSAAAFGSICGKLRRDGTTLGGQTPAMSFEQLNDLIGVEEAYKLAGRYGVE